MYGNFAPNNADMVLIYDLALSVAIMLMYAGLVLMR